jgi:hypothetical protein
MCTVHCQATWQSQLRVHAGGNTASGVHGPTLTVLPDVLPAGGSITIKLNMSMFDAEVCGCNSRQKSFLL